MNPHPYKDKSSGGGKLPDYVAVQRGQYVIDLFKIEGEGDFPCPKCGNKIDPHDETDNAYTVVESKRDKNNELAEVTLICRKCSSTIKLTGFLTDNYPEKKEEE